MSTWKAFALPDGGWLLHSFKLISRKQFGRALINNLWMVEDASVFLKYCCPDCEFADENLSNFTDHAIANHKDAFALFPVENIVAEEGCIVS